MISSEELAKDYPELVEDFSDDEQATSDHMIKYWTNFAKYGNPTGSGEDSYEPAWNAVTPKEKVKTSFSFFKYSLTFLLELHGNQC